MFVRFEAKENGLNWVDSNRLPLWEVLEIDLGWPIPFLPNHRASCAVVLR